MLALSAAEGTIVISAAGGLMLVALLAFGLWWFKPFRSGSRRTLDRSQRERRDPPEE